MMVVVLITIMYAKDYFNEQSDRFITEYYKNHNLTGESTVIDFFEVTTANFSSDEADQVA